MDERKLTIHGCGTGPLTDVKLDEAEQSERRLDRRHPEFISGSYNLC